MTGNAAPGSNVRVVARIRPLSLTEEQRGWKMTVTSMQQRVGEIDNRLQCTCASGEPELIEARGPTLNGGKRWFELDAVLDKSSTQEEVYIRSGASTAVCDDIFRGYNATILAYGQTGAGKTHTMGTVAGGGVDIVAEDGVIPRACADLFRSAQEKCDGNAKVELSYLEIYNEEIRDLLAVDDKTNLKIRQKLNGEVYVSGLCSKVVKSPHEIGELMEEASRKRSVGATAMNAVSSRSHAICTLKISGVLENSESNDVDKFTSKLTLVDLAGSERIKKTGAKGSRKQEGININKGLFVLGRVVSALSEQGKKKIGRTHKPPYRDSKLTRLLQDSLGGNSRTIMIACVSPADVNIDESINTLRYATSARNIKNSATRNIVKSISPEEAEALKRENYLLKAKVQILEEELRLRSCAPTIAKVTPFESTAPIHDAPLLSISVMDDMKKAEACEKKRFENATLFRNEIPPACLTMENSSSEESVELSISESEPGDMHASKFIVQRRQDNDGVGIDADTPITKHTFLQKQWSTSVDNSRNSLQLQLKFLQEVNNSRELIQENLRLRQELEQTRSDVDSAMVAAAKLSDVIDQLTVLKQRDIDKRQIELNHMKKEEAWVLFVDNLVEARAEQIIRLSQTFDLVVRVIDSPAMMRTRQKKTWFGKEEPEEVYDHDMRQKVMKEHVNFFKNRMEEIQKDILGESRSLKQMRESIQIDCSKLQSQIMNDVNLCNNWNKGGTRLGSVKPKAPASRRVQRKLIEI